MKFTISTSFYKRSDKVLSVYDQIINQTYKNWEWIVTDDFSNEKNAEEQLIEISIRDPRVKYYKQSRKKEFFYNPQRHSTGDVIVMFDSDDFAYPKLLETYKHFFEKHREVVGICCTCQALDESGGFIYVQHGGIYNFEKESLLNFTPMVRAFKNIYPEFDNGVLNWFMNDLNIVRHMEVLGKWLFLPRVLCDYLHSDDSYSKSFRTYDEIESIEKEREFIENKFPQLMNDNNCTLLLYYLPIKELSRAFSLASFNKQTERKKLLFVNSNTDCSQRMLLKELFFDQDLTFDIDNECEIDEVIIYLDAITYDSFDEIIEKIRKNHSGKLTNILINTKRLQIDYFGEIGKLFSNFSWKASGDEIYFFTSL